MKIARAEEREGPELRTVLRGEGIDPRARRNEAEAFRFLPDIDRHERDTAIFGNKIPCVVGAEEDLVRQAHHNSCAFANLRMIGS